MSYIIKNNTQGAIVARLTDAGRKKLSEGKLNIGLFQIGDSEMCYDCYTQLPTEYASLHMLQAEHNAHNLTPAPDKNKGHIKYPMSNGISIGDTFGPTIPQHQSQKVYNTATARGFFDIPTQDATQISNGTYDSFSAKTGPLYTLSSDWSFCGVNISGSTTMILHSAATHYNVVSPSSCSTQRYSPVTGDLISVTYGYEDLWTSECSELSNSAMSQTLFYQVVGGNSNTGQTATGLTLTVDRATPNFSAQTACARVRVYPAIAGKPMINSSIYSDNATVSYWCDDTLSFNDCCDISTDDTKIWNLNINWTESVAGITSSYEDVDGYGSSGYCGSKEYFGYNSNDGQYFTDQRLDDHNEDEKGGTWHIDSNNEKRVVLPEDQKCIGIVHYTNNTTTDFYGEKFALEKDVNGTSDIGEARNFKMHMPWLMWHKNPGTTLGQTFYVDPAHVANLFPNSGVPHYMESNVNTNMNHEGLRYFYLTDDNSNGDTVNPVGKVFPDYKMVIIDDEELLTAMSYKSNRTYTLPSPYTSTIPAGTSCSATTCTGGQGAMFNRRLWMTYMLPDSGTTGTTGIHCNYYVFEDHNPGDLNVDIAIKFGKEFPYLNNGFTADRLLILFQTTEIGARPDPAQWEYIDVTASIPNHVLGTNITEDNLTNGTYYITGQDTGMCTGSAAVDYVLNDFITVATTDTELQFGDEYFFYGSMETDIMATIYEMRHVVQLGSNKFTTSNNPTWIDYKALNPSSTVCPKITEVGLYDNEFGTPDLMAIAKLQSPIDRECLTNAQQFTITIDF